jgi:site-specific recombinase XerD
MEGLGRVYPAKTRQGKRRWVVDLRPFCRIWSDAEGNPLRRKRDAERVLSHIRDELWRGRPLEDLVAPYLPSHAKPRLVQVRIAAWLEIKGQEFESGDLSPGYLRELERYARSDGHFSFWSGMSAAEIDYGRLQEWTHWLARRGIGAKTRWNIVAAFRSFVSWLYLRGEIRQIPHFTWPKCEEYEPTIISPDLQDDLLEAIPEDRRGIFLAEFLIGLRPGEARALDCRDYRDAKLRVSKAVKGRGERKVIRGTKTRRVRFVPVHPDLATWIAKYVPKPRLLQGDAPLFINPNTGSRWEESAVKRVFYKARDIAGLPKVSMYEAGKHSMATEAYARIRDERKVQAILGHADVRSTRRYARLTEGALVEVLRPRSRPKTDD